jgi:hypothetical protein
MHDFLQTCTAQPGRPAPATAGRRAAEVLRGVMRSFEVGPVPSGKPAINHTRARPEQPVTRAR